MSETPDLRRYVLARQAVTDLVRSAVALARDPDAPLAAECRHLLERLAESRFNLAVVGQFKRGKSTLLNAIVGREVLPAGVIPLTSAITSLTYGPRDRVLLRWRGRMLQQEVPLRQLADFVTERGNPGNERHLEEATVEVPSPALRRGVWFIDTPGVGSSDESNSQTTLRYLPEASAVIFVTSADAPLGEVEERFLRAVRAHVRKLLVVVNKVDLVGPDERDELLAFVRSRLALLLGDGEVPVHALSASQALAARMGGDTGVLNVSGLPEFEITLTRFLAEEQGPTFLGGIVDRLLEALDRADGGAGARVERDAAWSAVHTRVVAARDELAGSRRLVATPWVSIAPTARLSAPLPDASRRPRRGRAGPSAGLACAVCAAQAEALFGFLARWQYELSADPAARAAFVAAGGLCPAHTWQFQQVASPLTLALAYAPLVERIAAALVEQVSARGSAAPTDGASDPDTHGTRAEYPACAACRVLRASAVGRARELANDWVTPEKQAHLRAGQGLCLPHLELVLRHVPEAARVPLLEHELGRLEELSEDLHAYALKREAVRRGLINEREESAPRRGLAMVVGERIASAPGVAVQDEL